MYEAGRVQGREESKTNWSSVRVLVSDESIVGTSYDLYYGSEYVGGGRL